MGFFNSTAFAKSPSGTFLASIDSGGIGIRLEATQVQAVAAFLRVLNALENIRATTEIQNFVLDVRRHEVAEPSSTWRSRISTMWSTFSTAPAFTQTRPVTCGRPSISPGWPRTRQAAGRATR